MPIRAFVTQTIDQLTATLAALESALQGGSVEEIRASGITTRTGVIKQSDIQLRYNQCRYELYLRSQAMEDGDQKTLLTAQWTNPYLEKAMKVSSRSAVGVFGYPIPAPLVPPTP